MKDNLKMIESHTSPLGKISDLVCQCCKEKPKYGNDRFCKQCREEINNENAARNFWERMIG